MSSSHTVTIRTTTTTTGGYAYVGFIKTVPGILKVLETLFGIVILGIVSYYGTHRGNVRIYGFCATPSQAFIFLVSFACLLTTLLLLISSAVSLMSSTLISKALFEFMYHVCAAILYFTAGLALVIQLGTSARTYRSEEGSYAAGVMGLINAAFYIASAVYSFRSYRTE